MSLMFAQSFGNIFFPKDFKDSKSFIEIKNTKLSYSTKSCGAKVTVLGTILNKSDTKWKDINFEARFFNQDNELIDTVSDQNYRLVLLPNEESTFKVTGSADKDEEHYHSFKVVVKDARQSGPLF